MISTLLALALVVQDTVVLKPVVVTATRVPTPADAVASAVTVITGESLRARGVRTLAEALRDVVGLDIVETAGYGSQTSLFTRGGESDYTKVLLDGVPLNQPGGAYNFAYLTTDDVERIEIVRGPVSVLYGSDAVAGVVQVFTRTGLGAPRVDAAFEAGTYGASRVGATVSGRGSGVTYSVAASHFTADGLFPTNSGFRGTAYAGRLRATPDARTDVALTVRHDDDVVHYPTDGAGNVVDANQFAADRGPTVALDLGRRLSSRLELRALLGWHEGDGRIDDEPDGPGDTTGVFLFRSHDRVRRRSADMRANWRVRDAMLTGGLAVEDARLHSTNACQANFGGPFDCSSPVLDTTRSTHALFVQVLTGAGAASHVSTNLGLRVEDNSQFGTLATWRAGASWRLDGATRLRASAGTGFKDPTLVENFSSNPFATGNPNLRPERTSSWEGGIEHAIPGSGVTVAVTYFDQRFHDLVVYDGSRTPNFWNLARARSAGAEVQVDYVARAGLTASLSYTYLDTRVIDGGGDPTFEPGKRLIRRPGNAATVSVARAVGGGRGTATLGVRFVGDRDDLDFSTFPAPRVTLHAYTRVHASVEYTVLEAHRARPGLVLLGRADNLFDDRGREIANFPVRGRSLFFGGRIIGGGTR